MEVRYVLVEQHVGALLAGSPKWRCRRSIPESITAHTTLVPLAAYARSAASALTVATERSTWSLTSKSGQIR